jgi:hypothetical protein
VLLAFLPRRGSRPLHGPILWTSFGVLVQEVDKRGLECKLLVPPFIYLPFASLWTSWFDSLRISILGLGGLTSLWVIG